MLSLLVLVIVMVALVFRAAAPDWLPYVLDHADHGASPLFERPLHGGLLAIAILLSAWPLRRVVAA